MDDGNKDAGINIDGLGESAPSERWEDTTTVMQDCSWRMRVTLLFRSGDAMDSAWCKSELIQRSGRSLLSTRFPAYARTDRGLEDDCSESSRLKVLASRSGGYGLDLCEKAFSCSS